MTDEQLWDWVKHACNLHPNEPIFQPVLAQFKYVALCAVNDHIATESVGIQIDEWNGLTDRMKVEMVRASPKLTALELIELVEEELRMKNK